MSRTRVSAARAIVASASDAASSTGMIATGSWAGARGLTPPSHERWYVEIALETGAVRPPSEFDETIATRFQLDIYSEEWGVFFCHAGRSSWIRTADAVFVHGRDEFQLLGIVPPLEDIGRLLRHVEQQQRIAFQRQHASVRTNLPNAAGAIRSWVQGL